MTVTKELIEELIEELEIEIKNIPVSPLEISGAYELGFRNGLRLSIEKLEKILPKRKNEKFISELEEMGII